MAWFSHQYLWSLCLRTGQLSFLKIVLKAGLKKAPIFGWAMQFFQFVFLNRSWEQDEAYMTDMLQYAAKNKDPIALLIFPEGKCPLPLEARRIGASVIDLLWSGTDLSPSNLVKSKEFAAKQGLPAYNYVLQPRTKGFVHCLQQLRPGNTIAAVYDITMVRACMRACVRAIST